jgi:hypothetical protein
MTRIIGERSSAVGHDRDGEVVVAAAPSLRRLGSRRALGDASIACDAFQAWSTFSARVVALLGAIFPGESRLMRRELYPEISASKRVRD